MNVPQSGRGIQRTAWRLRAYSPISPIPHSTTLLATLLRSWTVPCRARASRSAGCSENSPCSNRGGIAFDHELSGDAGQALAKFGDQVVSLLRLTSPAMLSAPIAPGGRFARSCRQSSTPCCGAWDLIISEKEHTTVSFFQIITALNKISPGLHPEIELDRNSRKRFLAGRIMCH